MTTSNKTKALGPNHDQERAPEETVESWRTLKLRFGTTTRRQTLTALVKAGTVLWNCDGWMCVRWD